MSKGQLLKQNDDGLVETYEVNGLTYQYTGTFQNLEVLSLWEKYSAFDDVKEEKPVSGRERTKSRTIPELYKSRKPEYD